MTENIPLGPGTTWTHDSTECRYLKTLDIGSEPFALIKRGHEYENVPLWEVAREVVASRWLTDPELQEHADDDWVLATLTSQARSSLLAKIRALNEVKTGSPTGYLDPGIRPRLQYDPATTDVTSRVEAMAAEMDVSGRTIFRWLERYDEAGASGLLHGNTHVSNNRALFTEAEIQVATEMVAGQLKKSTKTVKTHGAILAHRFREAGLEPLSAYRAKKLLDEVSRGKSLFGTWTTRGSKASRPPGNGGFHIPSIANEQWDIDSITADVFAYSPLDPKGSQVYGIAITDHCTRVLSVHLSLTPPSATSAAIAVFRRMNPLFLDDPTLPRELLLGVPKQMQVDGRILIHPGGEPGRITMDLGREYENEMFTSLLRQIGTTVHLARPRTGADKAMIESANKRLALVAQLLPGHKGNSSANRGEHPERDRLFTLKQLQAIMNGICAALNNKPHRGLRHPGDLTTLLTPAQAHVASVLAGAEPRIPPQTNLIFQFLPVAMAVVSGAGPSIKGIDYVPDPGGSLESRDLQRISAGDRHVKGIKLPFRYDPSDRSRIYWHEPGTARWHTLYAVGPDDRPLPPLSDVWFDNLMDEMSQRRPTHTADQNWTAAVFAWIERKKDTPKGRRERRDEFNRFQQRLTDPELQPDARRSRSGRNTSSTSSPEPSGTTGSLSASKSGGGVNDFSFDYNAYLQEVDEPPYEWIEDDA